MARAIALAILLALIAPSFLVFASSSSAPGDNLPACCRRDGKHHCAMMMAAEHASSDHRFASVPETCPFRDAVINGCRTAVSLASPALSHFAELISYHAHHEQVFAAARVSEARSHQKRGPPTYLKS